MAAGCPPSRRPSCLAAMRQNFLFNYCGKHPSHDILCFFFTTFYCHSSFKISINAADTAYIRQENVELHSATVSFDAFAKQGKMDYASMVYVPET
jgi:hypothetical protein